MSKSPKAAIAAYLGADRVRIQDGHVDAHGPWPRGDGGPSPYWKFAGYLNDLAADVAVAEQPTHRDHQYHARTFAELLRYAQLRHLMTAADIARLTGLSTTTIYRHLEGKSIPTTDHVRTYCAVLKISETAAGAALAESHAIRTRQL